jgi:ribonuclease HII
MTNTARAAPHMTKNGLAILPLPPRGCELVSYFRHSACYDAPDMAAGPRLQPSTAVEEVLWASSRRFIAGVDEVGRGPLAGPVYAAAVILDPDKRPGWLDELRDSKVLLAEDRERLSAVVRAEALAFGIGWATVGEIDGWGIGPANKMAMIRALMALPVRPQYALIDGPLGINYPLPQKTIVDGDATCTSIAAASIVAKVARDALMCELDCIYPEYGFAMHKGYATPEHLARIERYGACVQHRRSWAAVQRRSSLAGLEIPAYLAREEQALIEAEVATV